MNRFENQTAVITGGGTGIGLAIAEKLAATDSESRSTGLESNQVIEVHTFLKVAVESRPIDAQIEGTSSREPIAAICTERAVRDLDIDTAQDR